MADLVTAGAVRRGHLVKILGDGEISVPVQVSAHAFSGSAKEKIAASMRSGSAPIWLRRSRIGWRKKCRSPWCTTAFPTW